MYIYNIVSSFLGKLEKESEKMPNYRRNGDYERMSNFGRNGSKEKNCPSNTTQEVNITVPVAVSGSSNVGKILIDCVGCPVIEEGVWNPTCEHRSTTKFTVSQKIQVEIPIVFDAEVEVGNEHVAFEEPKETCSDDSEQPSDAACIDCA